MASLIDKIFIGVFREAIGAVDHDGVAKIGIGIDAIHAEGIDSFGGTAIDEDVIVAFLQPITAVVSTELGEHPNPWSLGIIRSSILNPLIQIDHDGAYLNDLLAPIRIEIL